VSPAEGKGWLPAALTIVGLITGLRLVLLAFDRTDLFVDEAQYWLWGQHFAFGYFSKPPLIAWLIGAVTGLAHSDAIFWVRMPGAILHGATALILAALAARIGGRQVAVWVAAAYVTLPMVALGSVLISTDTVLAPFFAAGLFYYHRLMAEHRLRDAALVGVMAGIACLAKYAGVYLLAGIVVAALCDRTLRPRMKEALLILLTWAAFVSPNLIWNLTNGLSTLNHTGQNIGWIEHGDLFDEFGLDDLFEFWGGQLAVVGPIMFGALLLGLRRFRQHTFLVALAFTPIVVVSVQAMMDQALANWAITTYFAGTVLAMLVLSRYPRWRLASVAINGAVCLALPILTLFPGIGPDGKPLLQRYIGRAAMSEEIMALSRQSGSAPIATDNRDILADLFYTGRGQDLRFFSTPPLGKPKTHYEQSYPLPADLTGTVLLVTEVKPSCATRALPLTLSGTAYRKTTLAAYPVAAECARTVHSRQGD
jgi:hypothetical protein